MNNPKAVELLQAAKNSGACAARLAQYEAKAEAGTLSLQDLTPDDAVWLLAIVKPPEMKSILKAIASRSNAQTWLK